MPAPQAIFRNETSFRNPHRTSGACADDRFGCGRRAVRVHHEPQLRQRDRSRRHDGHHAPVGRRYPAGHRRRPTAGRRPGESRRDARGSVYATDLFTGEVVNVTDSTMPGLFLSFSIAGIAADLSGSRLYVSYGDIDGNSADGNLKVAIIDVPTSFTDRVQHFTSVRISTPGFLSGAAPGGIAVNRSGTFVYATVPNEKTLAVIDTANNNSVTPIEVNPRAVVNPRPVGVALDPLETRVYVGNSGDGTVTVLDATTQTVVKVGTRRMVRRLFGRQRHLQRDDGRGQERDRELHGAVHAVADDARRRLDHA